MTHEEKVARWIGPGKIGVEIGAFKSPIPGLAPRPIYVDRFRDYAGERCLADYYGDATELPFRDNSLDYVVTSHVLEHVRGHDVIEGVVAKGQLGGVAVVIREAALARVVAEAVDINRPRREAGNGRLERADFDADFSG